MKEQEMERTAEVAPSRGPLAGSVVMEKMHTKNIYSRLPRPCATLIGTLFGAHSQILTALEGWIFAIKFGSCWHVQREDLPVIAAFFTPANVEG